MSEPSTQMTSSVMSQNLGVQYFANLPKTVIKCIVDPTIPLEDNKVTDDKMEVENRK